MQIKPANVWFILNRIMKSSVYALLRLHGLWIIDSVIPQRQSVVLSAQIRDEPPNITLRGQKLLSAAELWKHTD